MHKLLETLMKNDLFMSFRPEVDTNNMVVTFRKTGVNGKLHYKTYKLSEVEVSRLSIDIVDVLEDFVERFMKEFNEEEDKLW